MADGYISQITLPDNNTYDLRDQNLKVYSGTCTTAAGTAIKNVVTDGTFILAKGSVIFVNFSVTNSAAVGNLKLKFNGEADENAKSIKYLVNGNDPANIPGAGYLRANQTYMFQYDGTNWVVFLNYYTYSNDFASRIGHYNNILARKAIAAESLIVGDATGYEKVASGVTFDLAYSIVWCTAAVAANASNYANMFLQHYDRNIATGAKSGFTSSANKVIYLIVTINGNIATVDSNIITDTLPSEEDGKVYITLGKLGAQSTGANYFFFYPTHPMLEYKNGSVRTYEAPQNLNEISDADDLKAIEAISDSNTGLLKKTGANTWTLDNSSYVTSSGVTNITTGAGLTGGPITGTGTISISGMNTSSGATNKWLNQKGGWSTPTASEVGAAPAVTGGYLPLSGGIMTGNIRRYYSATSTEPMITALANNIDIYLFQVGHGTAAQTNLPDNGYKLLYKGTGSSTNNYLQLIATKPDGTEIIAAQIDEIGNIVLGATAASTSTTSGALKVAGGLGVAGQVTATRLAANGSNTSYNLYVNGSSYLNGNTYTKAFILFNSNAIDSGSWLASTRGLAPTATTTDGNTTYSGAVIGTSILTLGNNKIGANSASGVNDNAKGYLRIYGASNGYGELAYNDSMFTSNKSIYLTNSANSGINNEIRGIAATNDYWRVAGGATASNAGYMELATADDQNEPIYVRQYSGVFATLKRTATLLDASGNTEFPIQVTAPKFIGSLEGNADTATTATSANNANYLYPFTDGTNVSGTSDTSILTTLYADDNIPRNVPFGVKLQHGNTSVGFGYFYPKSSQYGGWYIANYGGPSYIGVNNGTWTSYTFLTNQNSAAGTNNNATLTWNTTYTIAKINGTDIKFTTMAKPTLSDLGAAASSHNHAASDINSGELALDRIPTITNAKLANSSLTVGNKEISLGGSGTIDEIFTYSESISTNTSWDKTATGAYYVASSSAFTGSGNPGINQEAPYSYGGLYVLRAGNGGAAQFYISDAASGGTNKAYGIRYRSGWNVINNANESHWRGWATILDDKNFNLYAPTLTGTGASGSWGISITGTAAKATADASGNTITTTYAPLASPALTGTPTAPTAANGTNTTQIATTAFVNNTLSYINAMKFKGTLGTGGTITALPVSHEAGDTYRVITAGTWAGKYCEVGTLIICIKDGTAAADADWTSIETNEDGAVIGPASATDNGIVLFSGNTGRIIKDSSKTITTTAPASSAADTTIPTSKAVWSTIAGLDFTEIGGGTGDYISKISQTDGKISATKSTTTSTFTITGGTTAGPTIKISINGVDSTNAPAIPSASGTASGIVTTDTQAFAGAKTFNTSVTVKGDIIFPQANKLDWNDGTYRQRLVITDDSTANTAVFTFQQSANSGTNYSNLFTILDNKSVATDRYCYTISDTIKAYTQYNSTDDSIDFIFA